jgi:hypothetical protein
MAYRLFGIAVLLFASTASAARIAVVVEGGDERAGEIGGALRAKLATGADQVVDGPAGAALEDGALAPLRAKLDVARVVVATVQRQGKDRFLVVVRAADESGIARRYGEATGATLVDAVVSTAASLPALPAPPTPAAAAPTATATASTTATTASAATATATAEEAPAPADVAPAPPPPSTSSSSAPPSHRRKHEYGLLIGGIVAFLVPWLATVGFAAHYLDYNPNAARLGFIPVAGPFLGRQKINDKDLHDGYDVGLTVDGAIQIVGTSVLVAGILYAAIGVPARSERAGTWRPLFAAGPGGAQLGAQVSW